MKKICYNEENIVYDDGNKWIVKGRNHNFRKEVIKSKKPKYVLALVAKWGYKLSKDASEKDLLYGGKNA